MSDKQRVAFNIIRDHFLSDNNNHLFMIITGLCGSGKSFVIEALRTLLNEKNVQCILWNSCIQNKGDNITLASPVSNTKKKKWPIEVISLSKIAI